MTTFTIPKRITQEGDLIVMPRKDYEKFFSILKIISKDQIWFWTKEWQQKEKEADEDIVSKKLSPAYKTKREIKESLTKLKNGL